MRSIKPIQKLPMVIFIALDMFISADIMVHFIFYEIIWQRDKGIGGQARKGKMALNLSQKGQNMISVTFNSLVMSKVL